MTPMASKVTFQILTRFLANPGSRLPLSSVQKLPHNVLTPFYAPNVRFLHKSSCLAVHRSETQAAVNEGVKNEDKIQGQPNQEEKDLSRELINSLALEEIDLNLYRGSNLWRPMGGRGAFGGQIVGQALAAAGMTKPEDALVHSLHCYFVKTGDTEVPVLYHVDRIRDGKSICTRTVNATQKSKTIMTMAVSYHKPEETSLDYQYKMPDVPSPEDLPDYEDYLRSLLKCDDFPEKHKGTISKLLANEVPVALKVINPTAFMRLGGDEDPKLLFWIRAKGHIGDNENIHHCVAAYLSDMMLLRSAMVPFPHFRVKMMASLDHAMWFHSPFQTDEWMLYECECPRSVSARSFTQGRFWRQDGVLACTVAQEGIIRGYTPEKSMH